VDLSQEVDVPLTRYNIRVVCDALIAKRNMADALIACGDPLRVAIGTQLRAEAEDALSRIQPVNDMQEDLDVV